MFRHKKTINKDIINKQFEDFLRRTKLKAYFKNQKNKNHSSKKGRFIKPTNKNWITANKHHNIETFLQATRNKIQDKIGKTRTPSKHLNLTTKEQKAM